MEEKKVQELSQEMMDKVTGGLGWNEPQIRNKTCPSCGQPVAASICFTGNCCPHCGKPIPAGREDDAGTTGREERARIL